MPLKMKLPPLAQLPQSLILAGLCAHLALAQAQTAEAPAKIERVEVTGSRIKRIQDEGALPIQSFSAAEINRMGITNAEQLLQQIAANSAGADNATSNNNVFGGDTDRLTGGSTNANLRGLGPGSTLVLLNGRRLASYGMSGGAVDLNTIPIAAIERVEVLKDGASAIYGTDAIGGVINYILKKDLSGVSLGVDASKPLTSGGGGTRKAQITGGFGSLEKQGVNVLFSLSLEKADILRASDRSWADGFQPERGLSPNSSSSPFANVIGAAGSALPSTGSTVGSTDALKYTRINLLSLQGGCDQVPTMVQFQPEIWTKPGVAPGLASGRYLCNTDYGAQFMLAPPKQANNLVLRTTAKLADDHLAIFEVTGSRVSATSEFTPYQFSTTAAAGNFYPVNGPYYQNLKTAGVNQFNPNLPIAYRLRMQDWGYRTIENVSENTRVLVGMEGALGAYDYKLGLSKADSQAYANLIDGYAYAGKLNAALKTGLINPWVKPGEKQTPEAMALIESTKARGRLQGGTTGLIQFDGSLSGEWMKLPAGPLGFAVGFDQRRETYQFGGASESEFSCISNMVAANAPNEVMGCPGNSSVPPISRNVLAVFGEVAIPVFKGFDLQLALRRDQYSDFGATTNPKIAFRYAPIEQLVLRGSVNTGFKAPSFQQLLPNLAPRLDTGKFSDPVKCPSDPTQCDIQLNYTDSGDPNLQPETSKQGTLGLVFSPMKDMLFYADYWRVDLDQRIRKLAINELKNNYEQFAGNFERGADGNITIAHAGWINAANSSSKGLDWGASYGFASSMGRFNLNLSGTHMFSHKERSLASQPLVELVGAFGLRTLYLKDKANANLSWSAGNWSSTLNMVYKSGYLDQDLSDRATLPAAEAKRSVDSYTTFGLFTTYQGFKNTSLTIGLRNLFDKQPPFTHHDVDDVAGAGWDPRVADPFGRTLTLSARYEFK